MCLNAPKQLWWTLCLELLFTRSTPQCHFSPQSRIMSLSEIQLRDPSPLLCTAAQISFLFPLLKPLLAPQLPGGWKITALSAKCGRCFSRISWPGEYCSSPPECKRSTLCCHPMPGLSSVLDGWLGILYLIKAAAVLYEKTKTKMVPMNLWPSPFHNSIVTVRLRLCRNSAVGKICLVLLPARAGIWQRNKNLWHLPPTPKIIYWGHFCQTGGLFQRELMFLYSA